MFYQLFRIGCNMNQLVITVRRNNVFDRVEITGMPAAKYSVFLSG
jgi:hypothetical protein